MAAPLVIGAGIAIEKAATWALIALGAVIAVGVGTVVISDVIDLVDDWIDDMDDSEAERSLERVGEVSRTARQRDGCERCKWCQIVIQAQGYLIGPSSGSTVSLGPYFRLGQTVTTREGVTVLGATHLLVESEVSRRDFREIEKLRVFSATSSYISARPPAGLPPGEYRAGGSFAGKIRYDINVTGTINAFLF